MLLDSYHYKSISKIINNPQTQDCKSEDQNTINSQIIPKESQNEIKINLLSDELSESNCRSSSVENPMVRVQHLNGTIVSSYNN